MSYQTLIIVGRLGKDPKLKYTASGQAVTNFNVATDRQYSIGDGQTIHETTWFRITVWGRQAENCNAFLRKGQQVLVEGRLTPDENGNPRTWSRQDGTPGASYEVTAATVRFLSPRNDEGGDAPDEATTPANGPVPDDIPF